ncbi:expressed unknown protein [Seminavis robusta]|uniref:Sulfotransferase n=1 Tax=Seminavis robusta TaxID=568900 RepID=A0A9N8E4K3_9STRA|nr:expressed unknown protein [Seminavis robusta]|eukprot:Sro514_g158190.1 n/a (191) ;mRNA; r:61310-62052
MLDTNWDHPNLVSFIVMREPISRSLAGDGKMMRKYPTIWDKAGVAKNGTLEDFWQFAQEPVHNNNYALRILSDSTCCNGSNTDVSYLEEAKEFVSRFTFVIDIACLGDSLQKLADVLGIELTQNTKSADSHHQHKTLEERIPYPKVLNYLKEKNKRDIELYEWSKTRSILECSALEQQKVPASDSNKKVP